MRKRRPSASTGITKTAAACCVRTCRTTGKLPNRPSTAISSSPSSANFVSRFSRASSTPTGTKNSSSSSRMTLAANHVYEMLSGKQQQQALVAHRPAEAAVAFRGPTGKFPGIPVAELTRDQRDGLQTVLMSLIEPYRKVDQDEVMACLKKQGGL